jgi:hypothetical protein
VIRLPRVVEYWALGGHSSTEFFFVRLLRWKAVGLEIEAAAQLLVISYVGVVATLGWQRHCPHAQ